MFEGHLSFSKVALTASDTIDCTSTGHHSTSLFELNGHFGAGYRTSIGECSAKNATTTTGLQSLFLRPTIVNRNDVAQS